MSMRPPASRRVRTPAIALALLVIVQSGPGGLWILSWRGKRARYARCRLTPCRRRVSHNTLDAADGAHRLHRHFRRTLDQDVKIGSRRPVTLRHRKEGTDRASSLRSDERSRSPESAFTFAEIGVHVQRNTHHTSATYAVSSRGQFSVSPGGQFRMSLDNGHRRGISLPKALYQNAARMSRGAEGTTEASGRRDQAGLAARKRRVGAVRGAVPAQNEPKSDRPRAKTPINRRKSRLRRRAAPI